MCLQSGFTQLTCRFSSTIKSDRSRMPWAPLCPKNSGNTGNHITAVPGMWLRYSHSSDQWIWRRISHTVSIYNTSWLERNYSSTKLEIAALIVYGNHSQGQKNSLKCWCSLQTTLWETICRTYSNSHFSNNSHFRNIYNKLQQQIEITRNAPDNTQYTYHRLTWDFQQRTVRASSFPSSLLR